ncbi:C6 zinc cluster transcription factor-like protein [Sporothrix epigloea]|uniref:C6 zinc cluster transcription factor-like protein n=1 Tax=Sporothrix epigloea TaxID=1892477 RepID=A0ABP0DNK7_9PEZI
MSLEYIYITRHGVDKFRPNWTVDPATGVYTGLVPSPTGHFADPALTSHGVSQSQELAAHLVRRPTVPGPGDRPIPVPVERIYSSPYYRCLQTIQPFVQAVSKNDQPELDHGDHDRGHEQALPPWWAVRCDPGLVDWFGPAPFEQPKPASLTLLHDRFFPWIDLNYTHSGVVPRRHGESMAQLHARVAATLTHIIRQCDAEGVRAIVLCTHAASIIAMGRVLTGQLPEDVASKDFDTFTCGLSTFRRRHARSRSRPHQPFTAQRPRQCLDRSTPVASHQQRNAEKTGATPSDWTPGIFSGHVPPWDDPFQTLGGEAWIGGRGVEGGWDCEENSDCSFLSKGEERGCLDLSVTLLFASPSGDL